MSDNSSFKLTCGENMGFFWLFVSSWMSNIRNYTPICIKAGVGNYSHQILLDCNTLVGIANTAFLSVAHLSLNDRKPAPFSIIPMWAIKDTSTQRKNIVFQYSAREKEGMLKDWQPFFLPKNSHHQRCNLKPTALTEAVDSILRLALNTDFSVCVPKETLLENSGIAVLRYKEQWEQQASCVRSEWSITHIIGHLKTLICKCSNVLKLWKSHTLSARRCSWNVLALPPYVF